jgi:hypothetical protein
MIAFNQIRDLHSLDITEEDRDMSWEYSKMTKYFNYKEADGITHHNCLEEWNDINKTQS